MQDTILNLMVNHHLLIDVLFASLRDEAKEKSERAKRSLAEFTWELKKHFFVEENAIFDHIPLETIKVFETLNHLRDEHLAMLQDLEKFSENLNELDEKKMQDFFDLMEHHRKMEEKELYPKLDKELSDGNKKEIIGHINQVPLSSKK